MVVHQHGSGEVGLFEPAELFAVGAVGEDAEEIAVNGAVDEGVDAVEKAVG